MYQTFSIDDVTMIRFVIGDELRWIPTDDANCDYQAYLAWVADGNIAEEWQPEQETN